MARKKQRDAKFIIYQCLYIFVIAFLAMKDATILSAGEENPNKLKPTETKIAKIELDSIRKALDSLKSFNMFVDTSKDTIITKRTLNDKDNEIIYWKAQKEKIKIIKTGDNNQPRKDDKGGVIPQK